MNILFTYLVGFSGNGGIQKFNRCFIKALDEISESQGWVFKASSAYDKVSDKHYIKDENFKAYNSRSAYVINILLTARKYDLIILGHINMFLIGLLIRIIYPDAKIMLVVHGIEIWRPLNVVRQYFLKNVVDKILSVSEFTKNVIIKEHKLNPDKIKVFYNTIDPHFKFPQSFDKPSELLQRYSITKDDVIMLTLARLSSAEKFKGYDLVLEALGSLKSQHGNLKYVIAGKYDSIEGERIKGLIKHYELENKVILTGFVEEEEVTDHYLLADFFIMPSKKEGFGIVFIEAMACGLTVIAGNKDGSSEALLNGELGLLVDPASVHEIKKAIQTAGASQLNIEQKQLLQKKVTGQFGYHIYKERLFSILQQEI